MTKSEIEAVLKVRDEISAKLDKIAKRTGALGGKFKDFSKTAGQSLDQAGVKMKALGGNLMPLSIGLGLVGGASMKFAMDLNKGMANVATLIPGNTERVLELKKGIQDLAIAHGKSTSDLVGGLYQTISAFGDTADTAKILEINSMAATAGIATTAEAINLTSTVTEGYGDTTAKAVEKVTDLAFVAVRLGKTTFPELASSIGNVIPLATSLHVSQEELFATFAALTKVIPTTAEVGTSMRSVLQSMVKPTNEMEAAIAELGKQYGFTGAEAMVAQLGMKGSLEALIGTTDGSQESVVKLFGRVEALTAAMLITGASSDTVTENLKAMIVASGAAKEAFDEQREGINKAGAAWDTFKAQVEVAAQKLGDELLPIIMDAATELKPLGQMVLAAIKGFGDLSTSTKTLAVAFGGLVVVAAPLLMFFGSLTSALGALVKTIPPTIAMLGKLKVAMVGIGTAGVGAAAGIVGIGIAAQTAIIKMKPGIEDHLSLQDKWAHKLANLTLLWWKTRDAIESTIPIVSEVNDEINDLVPTFESGSDIMAAFADKTGVLSKQLVNAGTIAKITSKELDHLRLAVQELGKQTEWTAAAAQGMTEAEDALARASAIVGKEITNVAIAEEVLRLMRTQSNMETITATQRAEELLRVRGLLREETDEYAGALPPVVRWETELAEETDAFNAIMQKSANLVIILGSSLGNLVASLAGAASGFKKLFGAGESGKSGFAKLFSGFTTEAGKLSFSSFLGGFANALPAIGALVGPAIAIFGKLFKPKWKKLAEESAKIFGKALSEGLAKEVLKAAKTLGSVENAYAAKIGDIVSEVGVNAENVGQILKNFHNLIGMVENGTFDWAEAVKQVDKAFGPLVDHLQTMGMEGNFQIGEMINRMRELGLVTEEVQKYIKNTANEFLSTMAPAYKYISSLTDMTAQEAIAFSGTIVAGFAAAAAATGSLIQAVQMLGDSFRDAFKTIMDAIGPDGEKIIGPIAHIYNFIKENEEVLGAFAAIADGLELMARMGILTEESLSAMGEAAHATFNRVLTDTGNLEMAIRATWPELVTLYDWYKQFGMDVPDWLQKAIDKGQEMGHSMDIPDTTLQVMETIRDVLIAIATNAGIAATEWGGLNKAMAGTPSAPGPGAPHPGKGGGPDKWQHGTPEGGVLYRRRSLIEVAESRPERVWVQPQGTSVGGGRGGDVSIVNNFDFSESIFDASGEDELAKKISGAVGISVRDNLGGAADRAKEGINRLGG